VMTTGATSAGCNKRSGRYARLSCWQIVLSIGVDAGVPRLAQASQPLR
jgi:hypothetical protein